VTPSIELKNLSRSYGSRTILHELSLQLQPGEFVGLLGPNGAGKSTLLKILSGHLIPGQGTALIGGIDVSKEPDRARAKMGIVAEEPAFYEYLTAREFLEFVAGVRDITAPELLEDAIRMSGLQSDADRPIREYSQGMRRRTALAAAVLARPPVLILDEALNGLDPDNAHRVEDFLVKLCKEGTTILLSTHLLDTIERVATRLLMLVGGRIVADVKTDALGPGGARELFKKHTLAQGLRD
jgi:ABC-2 type transport system ATP-binding protein